MRIPCPWCGDREVHEFSVRGEAPDTRPEALAAPLEEAVTALHRRTNPAGTTRELWYHGAGCRSWLIVERDTRTHAVHGAVLAGGKWR